MKRVLFLDRILFGVTEPRQRTLSVLMIISLICSYFALYTGVGALVSRSNTFAAASNYTNVSIIPTSDVTYDDMLHFVESNTLGEMANVILFDIDEQKNDAVIIGWKGTQFSRWHAMEAGKDFFSDEQVESNDLIAICNDDGFSPPISVISISGKEYQVVQQMTLVFFMLAKDLNIPNVSSYPQVIILPYRTFIEQGFDADVIRCDFGEALTHSESEIKRRISEWYPSAQIIFPPALESDDSVQEPLRQYFTIFVCMCCMALMNVFIMYNQLLIRLHPRIVVYAFCGASRVRLVRMLLGLWLMLNCAAAVIAYGCTWAIQPIWSFVGMSIPVTVYQGFMIFLLTAIGTSTMSIIPILNICRSNIRPRGGIA